MLNMVSKGEGALSTSAQYVAGTFQKKEVSSLFLGGKLPSAKELKSPRSQKLLRGAAQHPE